VIKNNKSIINLLQINFKVMHILHFILLLY